MTADESQFFETKIRPVLAEHCYECHSANSEKVKGELMLDTRVGTLRGGTAGPAVVPGKPEESLLIEAVRYADDDLAMPPKKKGGKLPDEVIADLERWVRMGAPDPREGSSELTNSHDPEAAKDWWAYQPVATPAVPETSDRQWPRSDIDRFILAKLEEQGLRPAGAADKATLLRRVFLDLTGLPPAPEFQAKFLASEDPEIFARIVDWLLDSRQFGERWGRHWLDVARFAETTGRDLNLTMPEAWRYRDYVIESFAAGKPFDQFIREQIAGDLLPSDGEAERAGKLVATGFLAVGPKGLNEIDPRQFAVDLADEQIDAVSQAFLGTTISCARCHDHKFDPITQRDYTALAGIFLSTETHFGTPGGVRARNASDLIEIPASAGIKTLDRKMDPVDWAEKKAQYDAVVARRDAALASRAPGGGGGGSSMSGFDIVRMMTRAKQIEVEISAFNADGTAKSRVMGVSDKPAASTVSRGRMNRPVGGPNSAGRGGSGFDAVADSPLFLRGSIAKESDPVPRGVPSFLSRGAEVGIAEHASGRLELADWIASPENPLTARVAVNRAWHWLFGRGLVESVDNFGTTGSPPSHPGLLDHLATHFIADGWSVKKLVREIVLSRAYQLDSLHDEKNLAVDPDNKLVWRSNARRLDAETIRDATLSASGLLDPAPRSGSLIAMAGDGPVGGPRFQILKVEEIADADGPFRSVYLPVSRSIQPASLALFDFSDPNVVQGARETTIVPPQSLYLMNSDFMEEQAVAMAKRVMEETGFDKRFSLACRLAYCREPFADELSAAGALGENTLESWTSICRALLASADFLFVN